MHGNKLSRSVALCRALSRSVSWGVKKQNA